MREAFNKMKTIMLFVCIGLGTVFAQAQDYNVSGTILDDAGLPLPGASIIEKGTQNGAESDFDGNFTIVVANGQATLEVLFCRIYYTRSSSERSINYKRNFGKRRNLR